MASEFKLIRRVQFAETDMAGILHFAEFFRYMEETEHAFFRSLGLSVQMQVEGRTIGWPRVRAECDYKSRLRFEDEVEVCLRVAEKRAKSLTYDFVFRKLGEAPPVEVARGRVTTVCVAMDERSGQMKAVAIPAEISRHIEVSDAARLE